MCVPANFCRCFRRKIDVQSTFLIVRLFAFIELIERYTVTMLSDRSYLISRESEVEKELKLVLREMLSRLKIIQDSVSYHKPLVYLGFLLVFDQLAQRHNTQIPVETASQHEPAVMASNTQVGETETTQKDVDICRILAEMKRTLVEVVAESEKVLRKGQEALDQHNALASLLGYVEVPSNTDKSKEVL